MFVRSFIMSTRDNARTTTMRAIYSRSCNLAFVGCIFLLTGRKMPYWFYVKLLHFLIGCEPPSHYCCQSRSFVMSIKGKNIKHYAVLHQEQKADHIFGSMQFIFRGMCQSFLTGCKPSSVFPRRIFKAHALCPIVYSVLLCS